MITKQEFSAEDVKAALGIKLSDEKYIKIGGLAIATRIKQGPELDRLSQLMAQEVIKVLDLSKLPSNLKEEDAGRAAAAMTNFQLGAIWGYCEGLKED